MSRILKIGFDAKSEHAEVKDLASMVKYLEREHKLFHGVIDDLAHYMF